MRQRNVRYLTRMIVKTTVILLPIIIVIFGVFGNQTTISDEGILFGLTEELKNFYDLPINEWYKSFINIIGLGNVINSGFILTTIASLGLYFIWVEIFDLLLHLIFFFTDLFHKFLGGDK